MAQLSIIIPTFNEEKLIECTLLAVKERAPGAEVIVVDGESSDDTIVRASQYVHVITAKRGRGGQLRLDRLFPRLVVSDATGLVHKVVEKSELSL